MSRATLGIVGAGTRARAHLRAAYALRDQTYFLCERDIGHPHRIDHDYTETPRDWAEDVSDLNPAVTAVCDPDPAARAEAIALCADHGDDPEGFESFEAFLASDAYDAAMITTPNDYHVEQSLALLDRGVDTFCEKPVATTVEDHDRLIDAAAASSGLFYVGFNLRTSPFYARLKALVEDGGVGDLGMIGCRECRGHFHADYSFSRARSGGTFLDKNCHDFDLYNWYADGDPVHVSAFGGQHVHTANTDVNDQATAIVQYDDGTVATLELCMYAPFGERIRLYGLRGSAGLLRATEEAGTAIRFTREGRDTLRVTNRGGGHGGADIRQMKRFLRCLAGDADPPASTTDAKKADVVALAAERAIAEHRLVEIDADYDLD